MGVGSRGFVRVLAGPGALPFRRLFLFLGPVLSPLCRYTRFYGRCDPFFWILVGLLPFLVLFANDQLPYPDETWSDCSAPVYLCSALNYLVRAGALQVGGHWVDALRGGRCNLLGLQVLPAGLGSGHPLATQQ
jgi:hypothetical protein